MKTPLPPLMTISEASQPNAPLMGWPVLRLGFRPFYLAAALVASVSMLVWIGVFLGHAPWSTKMPALLWHAHEMLFGFAATVVMGFLLTAVKAWTGRNTARGAVLGALFAIWLAGRLAIFVLPYAVYAAIDVVLLILVALILLRVLILAGNKRNVPLVSLLLAMGLANLMFHLAVLEVVNASAMTALHAQLALIIMVVMVMAGRVIPGFTKNVTPGLVINLSPRFEMSLLAISGLAMLLWVVNGPTWLVFVLSAAASAMHAVRLWKWHPLASRRRPILWILHVSYVWAPVGFLLLALAQWAWVPQSLAIHAFGVGLMGGVIMGMITRTARGHTGRTLDVSRTELMAYVLLILAAVVRVLVPALQASWYLVSLQVAATLWVLAFGLYLWTYTPWLLRTRLDGKDG